MLRRLVAFLVGCLRIEVRGGRMERFLNVALEDGLSLWEVQRTPDRMRLTLTIQDFRRLRRAVRASRCRVHILRRSGCPFVAARLRARPALVAGAMACVALLLWLSGHVWLVRVQISGPHQLDPRAILAVAAEAGLKPGAWKRRVDAEQVQAHIQRRIPQVSWAVIRVQGTRAVIEVVEKAAVKVPGQAPCINLVARKNAVIEDVIPFQGEPMVKKGDVVRAGDILVECSLRFWGAGRPQIAPGTPWPPRDTVARTLVAQARIMARVTYQEYNEVALVRETGVPTGRTDTRWVLNWKGQPILQSKRTPVPFQRFEERRNAYGLALGRIWRAPVELVTVTAAEQRVEREPVPLQQVVDAARTQMEARLRWLLGPADQVLTAPRAEVVERGKEYAGIRLFAETLEDIALPREGTPPPPPAPAQPPVSSNR